MKQILFDARASWVEEKDMQTGYFHVEKKYRRDKNQNLSLFSGYQLSKEITIKERDITLFDDFISTLINSGNVQVSYQLESSAIHLTQATTRLQSIRGC
jgi:uncharacterized protein YggE